MHLQRTFGSSKRLLKRAKRTFGARKRAARAGHLAIYPAQRPPRRPLPGFLLIAPQIPLSRPPNPATLRGCPTERHEGSVARKGEGAVHCTVTEPDRSHAFRSSSVGHPLKARAAPMNPFQKQDIQRKAQQSPEERMREVIETVDEGIRLKWSALRAKYPALSEAEIDAKLREWLLADDGFKP